MATATPAVGGRSQRVIRVGRRGLQHAAAATCGGHVATVSGRCVRGRHHRRLPCYPPLPSQMVAGHATGAPADRRGGRVVPPLRRRRPRGGGVRGVSSGPAATPAGSVAVGRQRRGRQRPSCAVTPPGGTGALCRGRRGGVR